MAIYPFSSIEPRWQAYWDNNKTFRTLGPGDAGFDPSKPKYYVLDMFPYPSGSGLHVGHPEGYTATDIIGRYKLMKGFNVLHPMGWDAFGLPAEQHAIKTGEHPSINTQNNVDTFRRQLKSLGFAYDWDREVNTTDPDYVRWTQWIFLQLYGSYYNEEAGCARPVSELEAKGWSREQIDAERLAFVNEAPVNWSPDLGTVLANEEVEEWRAKGHTVERRPLRQWMLRITQYAQRLMDDLDGLDWPDSIKEMQRNWIGRSEGAEVDFAIEGLPDQPLRVFTTRPDTLFGATYMVLAPEHPLVDSISSPEQKEAIAAYQRGCASKSDLERTELNKDKTGVPTGASAINPVNGQAIPIWIADYVMMGYGTGAIMAVPGHDERDFEFATTFGLPILQVVQPEGDADWQGFTGNGISVNSSNDEVSLDGLSTPEAKRIISEWLQAKGLGEACINFKLRDWLFSRQRYWGEPFPLLWKDGEHHAVPENELPVLAPPMDDYKPTGSPEPLLSKAVDWVRYSECAARETNTMPQWAGSCWYYLRYCDARNTERFISQEAEAYWMGTNENPGGVDLYVGGTEHAVLHLLYARFWHKVLHDLGHLSTPEPFQRLVNQGLILGEDGQKMSKSIGNVVNPDEVVSEYGADSLRLYEMFMGPLEQVKPWNMKGVEGVHRFLNKVWRRIVDADSGEILASVCEREMSKDELRELHFMIKKISEDIEGLRFNTAIACMMEFLNTAQKWENLPREAVETLVLLLSPFAPHIAEELWSRLGHEETLSTEPWPRWSEAYLLRDEVEMVVQVNGKMRARISVPADADQAAILAVAKADEGVARNLEGKTMRKEIVVPGRLVNLVAN